MSSFQVLWATWAVAWSAWTYLAHSDDPVSGDEAESKANAAIVLGLILLASGFVFKQMWSLDKGKQNALLLIAFLGLGFAVWGRIEMGHKWTANVRPYETERVDTGPFAIVGHPIYTGVGVAAGATAIASGALADIIGAVLIVSGVMTKANLES